MRMITRIGSVSVLLVAATLAEAAPVGAPPAPQVQRVAPGELLPAWTYANLNDGVGGPPKIDLAAVLAKKPVVFCYWLPGEKRNERVVQELQSLCGSFGADKVALYGVVNPDLGGSEDQFRARVRELKLQIPVLRDQGFRLNQQLSVNSFPSIAIVDKEGKLRLANAGSLKQSLEYKMEVDTAVRRVAASGQLGTYGVLDRYYPAVELVGKKSPDFEAAAISDGIPRQWSSILSRDKVNVLVFWSVDCPHCRQSLPKFSDWLRANGDGLNVFGAARVANDAIRTKTDEFCKLNRIAFENLVDKDFEVSALYNIVSTPTMIIIRPDGVVDSVVLTGETDYTQFFGAKKKALLTHR